MANRGFPRDRLDRFATKVLRRAKMIIESPRTIDGRNVKRVASGELSNSLSYKIDQGRILRFSSLFYGYWVEHGRKPSTKMPPREPILKWMKIKGVNPRDARGRFKPRTESNMNSLAYLIQRKIAAKGYKGIHFYSKAVERELEKSNNDLQDATNIMVKSDLITRLKLSVGHKGRVR